MVCELLQSQRIEPKGLISFAFKICVQQDPSPKPQPKNYKVFYTYFFTKKFQDSINLHFLGSLWKVVMV